MISAESPENTIAAGKLTSRIQHQRRPSPAVTTDYGTEPNVLQSRSWSAVTSNYFAYSPAHVYVMDRLWDNGHAEWALQDFVHDEAALLDGPGGERFVVLARPLHRGQFLVAALAPPGIDGVLRPLHTPHGIAVPGDPVRAAADVERRLLPRYRHAVEAARVPALREAHCLAEQALADWDSVSDSLCDAAGMPLDEDAYGIRQADPR
jgi:hypothetical protein